MSWFKSVAVRWWRDPQALVMFSVVLWVVVIVINHFITPLIRSVDHSLEVGAARSGLDQELRLALWGYALFLFVAAALVFPSLREAWMGEDPKARLSAARKVAIGSIVYMVGGSLWKGPVISSALGLAWFWETVFDAAVSWPRRFIAFLVGWIVEDLSKTILSVFAAWVLARLGFRRAALK